MPYPSPLVKYVLSGGMPGSERWACGLYGTRPSGATTMTALAASTAASPAMTALLSSLAGLNNSAWSATLLTCYAYGTGATVAVDVGTAPLSRTGTASGALPNQTALVSTLRTAQSTKRGRGRCYWPATSAQLTTSGLTIATNAQGLADSVAAFVAQISAVVYSEVGSSVAAVTSVTVDNRTDVIRARAGRLLTTRYVGFAG